MLNCYGTIGILEMIAAFVTYSAVFNGYGFTFESIIGSAIGYKLPYDILSKE